MCRVRADLCFCNLAYECWCNHSWFFTGKSRIYYFGSLKYFWGASQLIFHGLRSMLVSSEACDPHRRDLNLSLNLTFMVSFIELEAKRGKEVWQRQHLKAGSFGIGVEVAEESLVSKVEGILACQEENCRDEGQNVVEVLGVGVEEEPVAGRDSAEGQVDWARKAFEHFGEAWAQEELAREADEVGAKAAAFFVSEFANEAVEFAGC